MTLLDLVFSLTVIVVITCGILGIGKYFDGKSAGPREL